MSRETLLKWVFYLLLAVLLGLELLFHPHPYFAWDGWFGFNAALGLVAGILLVLVARFLLRPLVKRDEEYYDR
jgi:hypothetical protein